MPRRNVQENKNCNSKNDISIDESNNFIDEINQQLTEADEYIAKKGKKKDNSILDSSEIPDVFTDDIISQQNNDQSIDEEIENEIDEEAKKSFVENEVFDAIVKFMKMDDFIAEKETEHREMIAPIKKQRMTLETFLIDYLEQIDQEFIKIGEKTKLTRVETETKAPIKPENVADALLEGFKKHELYTEEKHDEMIRVIKDMMTIVESKRTRTITKKIARIDLEKETKKKNAKEAKQKKKDNVDNAAKKDAKLEEKVEKVSKITKTNEKKANPKSSNIKTKKVTKTSKN